MYLLNLAAHAQVTSPSQETQTLLKYAASSVEVANIKVHTFPMGTNESYTINLKGLNRFRALLIKSTAPISVSLHTINVNAELVVDNQTHQTTVTTNSWTPPALVHYFVFNDLIPNHLIVQSTTSTTVELAIAGNLPTS